MTPDAPGAGAPVVCRGCGSPIGHEVIVGVRVLMRVGPVTQDAAHGWCACGAEYWWTSNELRLRDLLRRVSRPIDPP